LQGLGAAIGHGAHKIWERDAHCGSDRQNVQMFVS
jgi:hypothetical protein